MSSTAQDQELAIIDSQGALPFDIIAMKDIKDKKSRKGSLTPLFNCVEGINTAVDSLHEFADSNPSDEDKSNTDQFLSALTNMQIKLLEMCKGKVQEQNTLPQVGALHGSQFALSDEIGIPKES
jgi:hypothetical protein